MFFSSIALIRTANGRNANYGGWSYPLQWAKIYDTIGNVSAPIYGTWENTVNQVKTLNFNAFVIVENVACSNLAFVTTDNTNPAYWAERYELYKYGYILATWSAGKGANMVKLI